MAKITKSAVTNVFNGQADIVLFDAPTGGYTSSTTFANVTASGSSLGQVKGDSTSWDGEDATFDNVVDEQGNVIVAKSTAGTFGFSCELANVSAANAVLFLKGANVTPAGTPVSINNIANLVKAGISIPVIVRPIAIFNDEANRFIMLPKARILANLSMDNKLFSIKLSCVGEMIDTTELGTILIGDGSPVYNA